MGHHPALRAPPDPVVAPRHHHDWAAATIASAARLPCLCFDPIAVGLNGQVFTPDKLSSCDSRIVTLSSFGSTFTDWPCPMPLPQIPWRAGQSHPAALNSDESLCFAFSGTANAASASPAPRVTTDAFSTLAFTVLGAQAATNFAFSVNTPTAASASYPMTLAKGSLVFGASATGLRDDGVTQWRSDGVTASRSYPLTARE